MNKSKMHSAIAAVTEKTERDIWLEKLKETHFVIPRDLSKQPEIFEKNMTHIVNVINFICSEMNVSVEQMKERTRKQPIALTRQVLCYFLFKYGPSSLTLSEIGNAIGGRDHATVLYSLRIVKERVEVDKKFKAHLLELENSFIKYFPNSIPRE